MKNEDDEGRDFDGPLDGMLDPTEADRIMQADLEASLWRISPNSHTISCELNGFMKPDPFEGPGETYAAAYEREKARAEDLEQERDDLADQIKNYFGHVQIASDHINEAIVKGAQGYLRTCRSGGMGTRESDIVEAVVRDMARLGVFSQVFAGAYQEITDRALKAENRISDLTGETNG